MACGHFSDVAFVSAGKRRDFCRLDPGNYTTLSIWRGEVLPRMRTIQQIGVRCSSVVSYWNK